MKKLTIIALAILVVGACRPDEALKGIDGFNISLNSDIFKYRIHLDVKDENGDPIPNAEIELLGEDAEILFTEFGTREYNTNSQGKLTLAIHPSYEPTSSNPVKVEMLVKAADHERGVSSIMVNAGQFNLDANVDIWSIEGLKTKLGMEITPLSSSNGKISGGSILNKRQGSVQVVNNLNIDTVYYDNNDVAVLIEDGTSFYYYEDVYENVPVYLKTTKELFDTVEINGELVAVSFEEEIITDTIFRRQHMGHKKVVFIGDKIEYRTITRQFSDPKFNYTYGRNPEFDYNIETMLGTGLKSRAFLEPATKEHNVSAVFTAEVDGKPVMIHPENRDKSVVYSFVVNTSYINPLTQMPIAEGDSVEMGMVYDEVGGHFKTLKTVVKKAGNGQLRVQGNFNKYGFYKLYPYDYSVDLNYNVQAPDVSIIPDLENLRFNFSTYLTAANSGHKIHVYGGYDYSAKSFSDYSFSTDRIIYSDEPLLTATTDVWAGYWGTKWVDEFQVVSNNGDINILKESWSNGNNYKELTTYDLSVVCAANDSMVIYPTATANSYIGGYPVFVYLENGKWATRGLSIGDTMKFSIEYSKWSLDTAFVLKQAENVIRYYDETNLDICNL